NPNEITIRELSEVVAELVGVTLQTTVNPLPPDDPTRRCPDIARAKELLSWTPQVDLRTGLQRTIDAWPRTTADGGDANAAPAAERQGACTV
ncbi:MAG: SDR family NAD-dependent epimerase/dehydratase, partial [Candidatus Eremiobacteraeota bacterium]|nr:SDR family NAD-dependent epimerase/dehydratase [Candidatus Eremiobacteraeota bacterium]